MREQGTPRLRLIVASRNENKARELLRLVGEAGVDVVTVAAYERETGETVVIPEETGATFAENALIKARAVARGTGCAAVGDDSGLEVDALGGRPGVLSARFAGAQGERGEVDAANKRVLLERLRGVVPQRRTARFRCALAVVRPREQDVLTADGTCEGRILDEPRGTGGFGYDPLFYLEEIGRTMAELTPREKDRVSHRGRAVASLAPRLAAWLRRPAAPLAASSSAPRSPRD